MLRFTNGCDWNNRFGEVRDAGFDGLRINVTEIAALFPNKPVFKSPETRNYLYEVDWTSTASGVNKFSTLQWGQGNQTFQGIMQEAKAQGLKVCLHFNFNGYGGTWSTSNTAFSYSTQTITTSGATSGATSIPVTATTYAVPAGSVLCFCRGGSGFVGRFYASAGANAGATSISTWGLASSINASDVIAVIRGTSYIGTLTCSTFSPSTYENNNLNIAVSASGFTVNANDMLLVFRGGSIITTTTVSTRANAGASTIQVAALGATLNNGDFTNVPDAPTATEVYGYRHPDPLDASANADAALAMVAYVLNDASVLFPEADLILEEWNEPDQRVFGGCGVPGSGVGTYKYGWGFFSYAVKYMMDVRSTAVKAAFPNLPYLTPTFSYGLSTAMSSVRSENMVTGGFVQDDDSGVDAYWTNFSGVNMHTYTSTTDGSKASCAKRLYDEINQSKTNFSSITSGAFSSWPWYMTEIGIRPSMHNTIGVPSSPRFNGEMLLVTHDVCRAMGFALWANYCYGYRSTGSSQITASGTSNAGATSVSVSALGATIPVNTVLYFGSQGAKVVLTAQANQGATSITCEALPTTINNNDKSWYITSRSDGEYFHMIPDMITRNGLFIGVTDPKGKTDKFWAFAERFARVTLPTTTEPLPEY